MKNIPLNERLIFALDVDSQDEAKRWLDRLDDQVQIYKVGLQLFLAGWFPVIDMILKRNYKVMIDLKFFDIPETVGLAVRELAKRHATFITVHGNDPILRAAVAERQDTKVLAVTVLTSYDESDMRDMGMKCTVKELVLHRAKKALELGCDGVISSGLEAKDLRSGLGEKLLIVTPGIRPGTNDFAKDDQRRISNAGDAIRNGADYVVVGRPIRDAKDPLEVVRQMHDEIAKGLDSLRSIQ
jgi:orotidine-5'-phosphate decarboxylase